MKQLIGVFGFEKSIALKAECLNRKFQINIGNFKGKLLTASLPKEFSKKSFDYTTPLIQPKSIISFNEHLEWGRPYSWPSGDSMLINFMLEIEIDDKSFDDEQNNLLLNLTERWIERLKNNLYSFDYLIEYNGVKIISSSHLGFEYYFKVKGQKPAKLKSNREDKVEIRIRNNAIDFNTFKNVLKSTSQNKSLCDEYKLIKDSQIALENNEFRNSILGCASALELCLTNVLKRELKVNNEKLKKHILKMNNSIPKKIQLLKTIDIKLPPNNYQDEVSLIRDRVIHAGADCEEKQAEKAFRIVKQALDSLITDKLI